MRERRSGTAQVRFASRVSDYLNSEGVKEMDGEAGIQKRERKQLQGREGRAGREGVWVGGRERGKRRRGRRKVRVSTTNKI